VARGGGGGGRGRIDAPSGPAAPASGAAGSGGGPAPGEPAVPERAAAEATADGCGPVQVIPPYGNGDEDRAHVTELPPLSTYRSTPPASGPHYSTPMPAGVYPSLPSIGSAIHSLEHGAVIVWWDPSAAASPALADIAAFFGRPDEMDHVLVGPYDDPEQGEAGRLPPGQQMALVAWHRLQICQTPSLAVAYAFVFAYRADITHPERYRGEAPEPGLQI